MKILIATDGSASTQHAVDYLVRHTAQFGGAEVELLTVHLPIPGRPARHLGLEIVDDYYRDECEKALAPARRALKKAGVEFTDSFKVGNPGEVIAAHAEKGRFDMIIMGSHGHGALGNLVMGSVATKVLAGCKVPVLVIR